MTRSSDFEQDTIDALRSQLDDALVAGAVDATACPAAAELWAAAHGELGPEAAGTVARHAAICPRCRAGWRVAWRARRLEEDDAATGPESVPPPTPPTGARSPSAPPRAWLLPAAAALLLVAALVLFNWDRLVAPEPVSLSGESRARVEAVTGPVVPAGGDVVLRWRLEPPAADAVFDVTVSHLLEPIFTAQGLSESEVTVPGERLADVPVGSIVQWTVTASVGAERRRGDFTLRLE